MSLEECLLKSALKKAPAIRVSDTSRSGWSQKSLLSAGKHGWWLHAWVVNVLRAELLFLPFPGMVSQVFCDLMTSQGAEVKHRVQYKQIIYYINKWDLNCSDFSAGTDQCKVNNHLLYTWSCKNTNEWRCWGVGADGELSLPLPSFSLWPRRKSSFSCSLSWGVMAVEPFNFTRAADAKWDKRTSALFLHLYLISFPCIVLWSVKK